MNDKQFEDLLNNPYEPSPYFSSDRHFKRKNDISDDMGIQKCDPVEVLAFNSILKRNSDTVLSEAKSLLDGWMNKSDQAHVSLDDEFDYYSKWTRAADEKADDNFDIKRLIRDSIPKDDEKTSYQNLGMTLAVRQNMAKERRLLLEQQRKQKLNEKEKKIKKVRVLKYAESNPRPKLSGIDQQTAIKIVEKELEQSKNDKLQQEQLESLNALIETKKIEQDRLERELQMERDQHLLKIKEEKLQNSKMIVEIRVKKQEMQLKRHIFENWYTSVRQKKTKCYKFRLSKNWMSLQKSMNKWKSRYNLLRCKREMEYLSDMIKKDQINMAHAAKHWHEMQVQKQHEERARKMQEFLKSLEEKQSKLLGNSLVEQKDAKRCQSEVKSIKENKSNLSIPKPAPIKNNLASKVLKPSKKDEELLSRMKQREQVRLNRKVESQKQKELKSKELEAKRIEEENIKQELERLQREELKRKKQEIEDRAKQILIEKERQLQAQREKLLMAKLKHEKMICKYYGIKPWLKYIIQQRSLNSDALNFYSKNLVSRAFFCLKSEYNDKLEKLEEAALNFEQRRLLNLGFLWWKQNFKDRQRLDKYAKSLHKGFLQKSIVKCWSIHATTAKKGRILLENENMVKADMLAAKLVPKRVFRRWKEYVSLEKEERWREYRRNRLRQSAQQILSQSSILEHNLDNIHIDVFEIE
ncbi:hypothetical protein HDV06_006635 [Boothiomyces sp. JEL0866]|nr:hypothetical protein HDV06_006635 [Boothiomyces sp. JEL0866]